MRKISKADRCRKLRYKRPALADFGYDLMQVSLEEISEMCDELREAIDEDTLIDAFDGDEDEAHEFRWAFSCLEGEAQQLMDIMTENFSYMDSPARAFDDMSAALLGNRFNLVGYDDYEEDYFALTGPVAKLAYTEAGKRVMRMTKAEMLSQIGQTLGLILSYQNVSMKYEALKATADVIRDENTSVLQVIKEIEKTYTALYEGTAYQHRGTWTLDHTAEEHFDKLIEQLPDRCWIA